MIGRLGMGGEVVGRLSKPKIVFEIVLIGVQCSQHVSARVASCCRLVLYVFSNKVAMIRNSNQSNVKEARFPHSRSSASIIAGCKPSGLSHFSFVNIHITLSVCVNICDS